MRSARPWSSSSPTGATPWWGPPTTAPRWASPRCIVPASPWSTCVSRGSGASRSCGIWSERLPAIKAVVLTGYGSIASAVEAIKLGARHYLTKPVDPDAIEQAFERERGDPSVLVPDQPPSLALHEREYIEYVLASTGGNISEAARRLGLHRQSLQRKLRKYPPRR